MSDITDDRLYPVAEARERLGGISHATFYRMLRAGTIVAHKVGSRTVVKQSEIDRYLSTLPAVDTDEVA